MARVGSDAMHAMVGRYVPIISVRRDARIVEAVRYARTVGVKIRVGFAKPRPPPAPHGCFFFCHTVALPPPQAVVMKGGIVNGCVCWEN